MPDLTYPHAYTHAHTHAHTHTHTRAHTRTHTHTHTHARTHTRILSYISLISPFLLVHRLLISPAGTVAVPPPLYAPRAQTPTARTCQTDSSCR